MGVFFGFRGGNKDNNELPKGYYERVKRGDAQAALELNDIYVEGKGVVADDEQAYFWARIAGDLGANYGYYLTGLYHKEGIGVPIDVDKAYAFLDASRNDGNAFAFTELMRITEKRIAHFPDEEHLPLEELKRRAQNAPNAGEYFKNSMLMAAREEDVEGKNWAGLCLRDGVGVTPDQTAAAYWFREGANKDNMYACYNLAGMYESGRGVLLNYDEAIKWYGYAKELGHQTAQIHIDRLQKIKAKSKDELLKLALDNRGWYFNVIVMHNYYLILANAGISTACLWVGNDFRGEDGTKRDYYEARYYYAKTIVFRGPGMIANPEGFAYRMISEMYAMGQGVPVNMELANKYYKKAQETNSFAQEFPNITAYINNDRAKSRNTFEQATYYLEGYTSNPEVQRAINILEQEAQGGSYLANMKLASFYAYGIHVDADWRKMLAYINKARNCADLDEKRWDMMRQGCLLGYHNRTFGIGYDMFYDVVLNTASVEAFRSGENELAYAYLALARQFGMNVDWIEEQYAPRQPQDVMEQEIDCDYVLEEGLEEEIAVVSLSDGSGVAPEELPENLDVYFEGMIGMDSVKEQLNKIYQTVKMQLMRDEILRSRGEKPQESEKGYNFILLGNPGTGKTTVARIIAKILYDIRVRASDAFVEVERSSVVSDHVGGTEKRMREILEKVNGGTLFIDEAYALYKEDSDVDFGQEAIDVLMKDMEDRRNSYSVIMAGYKEPMLNMIRHANSGFSSRFSYTIELPDYSDEALIEIAHMHMEKQKFQTEEGIDVAIKKCIAHDKINDTFGNARYIRELVHRAIENQSQRLDEQGTFEPEELFKLRPEDFWQGTMEEEGVETYLEQLHALTGLESVKKEVDSLINTITVQKEMEKRGIQTGGDFGTLHMAFKGNPGTGKTTVARLIGKLYACLGVLKRGDVFVECTRAELVGKYQGHTAENVKKVVESALGGILFIDEAYSLVQGEGDSFGKEAVDTLVAEIENHRQNLVIIFAGYTRDIDEFFKNNQGLRSRVPKDLFFEDYNLEELYDIALGMLASRKLVPSEEAKQEVRARIFRESMKEHFGNARGIRNMIENIWRKQNVRVANLLKNATETVTDEMLLQVEVNDVQ